MRHKRVSLADQCGTAACEGSASQEAGNVCARSGAIAVVVLVEAMVESVGLKGGGRGR